MFLLKGIFAFILVLMFKHWSPSGPNGTDIHCVDGSAV